MSAAFSTSYKKLFLRGLYWDAQDNSDTLEDTLKAAARAQLNRTEQGLYLLGSSSKGHSVQYSLPSLRDATPQEISELCSQLFDLYEEKAASPGGTDAAIYAAMLATFKPIRSVRGNYRSMLV